MIILRKPSGEIVAHRCRKDCLFQAYEKLGEHKTRQFGQGGFVVTADAADVVAVRFRCPECGGEQESEGLCEKCRARWLPKR